MEPEPGPSDPAHAARLRAEVGELRAEIARLAERARASDESANLQSARLADILDWAARNEKALREVSTTRRSGRSRRRSVSRPG